MTKTKTKNCSYDNDEEKSVFRSNKTSCTIHGCCRSSTHTLHTKQCIPHQYTRKQIYYIACTSYNALKWRLPLLSIKIVCEESRKVHRIRHTARIEFYILWRARRLHWIWCCFGCGWWWWCCCCDSCSVQREALACIQFWLYDVELLTLELRFSGCLLYRPHARMDTIAYDTALYSPVLPCTQPLCASHCRWPFLCSFWLDYKSYRWFDCVCMRIAA